MKTFDKKVTMPLTRFHDEEYIAYEDLTEIRPIGRGSFGSVYRAEYLGTPVAVKEIRPSKEYNVAKYFQREYLLLRTCRHPNIVTFMGLCRVPKTGSLLIITEFVPNGNLRNLLAFEAARKTAGLSWRIRIHLAADASRAIAYLHSRDIIHRDLKGENMLITDQYQLKLCDFGFARKRAMDDMEMRRISYCGTEGYFAPEILLGLDYGPPADVFSLGCIFCEIACGKFMGQGVFTRKAPDWAIDGLKVRRLALKDCPQAFVDLALRCCSPRPEDRPKMRDVVTCLAHMDEQLRLKDLAEHPGGVKEQKSSVTCARVSISGTEEADASSDDDDSDDERQLQSALSHITVTEKMPGSRSEGMISDSSEAPVPIDDAMPTVILRQGTMDASPSHLAPPYTPLGPAVPHNIIPHQARIPVWQKSPVPKPLTTVFYRGDSSPCREGEGKQQTLSPLWRKQPLETRP